ncbi:AaceriAGL159Wp [[Ashbya] aceris (nom. inval.)]|nr:AaceriAGL159Wp [[Ashbya] aceris (nom. inval.)]
MIHPIQFTLTNHDGTLLFCVVKNMIFAYRTNGKDGQLDLAGQWLDDYDSSELIREKVEKEQQRRLAENAAKKLKTNEGEAVERQGSQRRVPLPGKDPKVPVPGPGAPPVYQYIRCLQLSHDEKMLVACTDSDKAAVFFRIELDKDNCLTLFKRQPFPKRPNAVTYADDDATLLLADKFGDVYAVDIAGKAEKKDPEPILGHVSMLTDIALVTDTKKKYVITADRDEHIKISHYPQSFVIDKWLFGHKEFVSSLCVPEWRPNMLFSAGGDSFIAAWDWQKGQLLSSFDYTTIVEPHLTDAHLPPARFLLNDGSDRREASISKLLTFKDFPYLVAVPEMTKIVLLLQWDGAAGQLILSQTLELPLNVVSATVASTNHRLILSLDNREQQGQNFAKVFTLENGKFTEEAAASSSVNEAIVRDLAERPEVQTTVDEIYPLYHVSQLRKRGEHYS